MEFKIHGKVQGVYFRVTTQARGRALGVTGWVKNLPDGTVLTQAQGPEQAVNAFMFWCQTGPAKAKVSRVEFKDLDLIDNDTEFSIL